jgi:hypothetical protein
MFLYRITLVIIEPKHRGADLLGVDDVGGDGDPAARLGDDSRRNLGAEAALAT